MIRNRFQKYPKQRNNLRDYGHYYWQEVDRYLSMTNDFLFRSANGILYRISRKIIIAPTFVRCIMIVFLLSEIYNSKSRSRAFD